MMHICFSHQRRITFVFAVIMILPLLVGLAGCGNPTNDSLITYHNEDYGFSILVDKELMEYIEVEKEISGDTTALYFTYVKEEREPDTNESPFLTWGRFFTILVEPTGAEPQGNHFQLLGSNEQYSFYFGTLDTPIQSSIVRERYEQYKEKINQIPSTFSIDK